MAHRTRIAIAISAEATASTLNVIAKNGASTQSRQEPEGIPDNRQHTQHKHTRSPHGFSSVRESAESALIFFQ